GRRVQHRRPALRARQGQGPRVGVPRRRRSRRGARAASARRRAGGAGRSGVACGIARHARPHAVARRGLRAVTREVLGTVGLGGIAALDAAPVAQTLLSQPLVTATLLGMLWHDMPIALSVGVVLQILAASTLPVGARTPEDYATGGVVGAGLALLLASQQKFSIARDGCELLGVIAGMLAAKGS